MSDEPDLPSPTPLDKERTAAFVARAWKDGHGLRVRVRSTLDLSQREEVVTLAGRDEQVIRDLVERLRTWIDTFAAPR